MHFNQSPSLCWKLKNIVTYTSSLPDGDVLGDLTRVEEGNALSNWSVEALLLIAFIWRYSLLSSRDLPRQDVTCDFE